MVHVYMLKVVPGENNFGLKALINLIKKEVGVFLRVGYILPLCLTYKFAI